ncbi:T9SS type A sorting domain-containing protein [Chryseobacterium aquaticum]|uniref:T9SS type A sorting domain-containing protein n=1 Tax=Chryseobacterium aquaticum TaxID=452084 RepID=A0A848N2A9_9FLAO|nr:MULTISPECIES: T9SS type A sorting domain-containing protein [Chryseobacterium]NMR32898.1 T9SS type A sorting domain-containing protein [Chryseobacterium aquaticum]NRQ45171.1 T9SS type A sorting domain-containing protein [Chryseobacterium sp. C-204]
MKKFFLIMLLCLYSWGYSQGENDNWYFGQYGALNFANPGSPTVLTDSGMFVSWNMPSGSVSDSSGKLLFYTDGGSIWNRDHGFMYGVSGVGLSVNAHQFAIVKHPTNNNLYYIINSGDLNYSTYTFEANYTLIDMSLGSNGLDGHPLGQVVNYKIPLLDSNGAPFTYGKGVTIVPHADMNSFWILISNNLQLYSYHLTSAGINPVPVTSSLYFENQPPSPFQHYSYIKSSPKLNSCKGFSHYLSLCTIDPSNGYNEGRVYSFDDNTGQITTNYLLEVLSLNPLRTEFNKNGSILYLAPNDNTTSLLAVDLESSFGTSINYSNISPPPANSFLSIQRNKYGEIFVQSNYNSNYISKIINPDIYGGSSLHLNYLNNSNPNGSGLGVFPPLIPTLNYDINSGCIPNINLTTTEINNSIIYPASNTITTQTDYKVQSGQNIVMKAGNNITLLPNTFIEYGADYLATIEACDCDEEAGESRKNTRISLDLRKSEKPLITKNYIKLYPNPTSDILNIRTDTKINSVSVVDMTGRKINVKSEGTQVDVRELPAGNYLINVETKDGVSTEKFIKK